MHLVELDRKSLSWPAFRTQRQHFAPRQNLHNGLVSNRKTRCKDPRLFAPLRRELGDEMIVAGGRNAALRQSPGCRISCYDVSEKSDFVLRCLQSLGFCIPLRDSTPALRASVPSLRYTQNPRLLRHLHTKSDRPPTSPHKIRRPSDRLRLHFVPQLQHLDSQLTPPFRKKTRIFVNHSKSVA